MLSVKNAFLRARVSPICRLAAARKRRGVFGRAGVHRVGAHARRRLHRRARALAAEPGPDRIDARGGNAVDPRAHVVEDGHVDDWLGLIELLGEEVIL